jgi:hypothetical protein
MSVSSARTLLRIFGAFYLLIGVLGFVPGITVMGNAAGGSSGIPGEGMLLGIFAVNAVHNVAHLAVGALALWAGRSDESLRTMGIVLAVVFAALVVGSFVAPIVEGVEINLPDTGLHLVSAILMAWVAFGTRYEVAASRAA